VRPSRDTQFATSPEGLRIAYQTVGSGAQDIVLIQPFQSVDVIWDDPTTAGALDRLARIGRLILLDYRGFGVSDAVPLGAMPTPEAWMEDTRVVLDAVGSQRRRLSA
jgi:pimeloyl-ACP methyl ester carboxylesterase